MDNYNYLYTMDFKTVFKAEHCEIKQVNSHALKIVLKGFLKITHLTTVNDFVDSFTKHNQINMLIIDQSGLKVLSKEVQEYMGKTISMIARKGLKKVAIIEAEDIFAKASFDKLHKEETKHGEVTHAVFHSEKAALEWLLPSAIN